MKVLVVDDNKDLTDILAEYFKAVGLHVFRAYSGEEALAQANAQRPDMAIMDLSLPHLSGFEVAARLVAGPASGAGFVARPVLVAYTGAQGAVERERAQEAGFDFYVTKPGDITLLRDIARLCDSSAPWRPGAADEARLAAFTLAAGRQRLRRLLGPRSLRLSALASSLRAQLRPSLMPLG